MEAAWINIHVFGGVVEDDNDGDDSKSVLEIRNVEGYGLRWAAFWSANAFSPDDVQFRGFLEPQMDGGHENRWRH